mmetsp:Transcript_101184/g.226057  ORF Transcript_101184/g.226057 Transcript_101184/m.226057 type:complete len:284 (-) Transcript_101184:147-998(-)
MRCPCKAHVALHWHPTNHLVRGVRWVFMQSAKDRTLSTDATRQERCAAASDALFESVILPRTSRLLHRGVLDAPVILSESSRLLDRCPLSASVILKTPSLPPCQLEERRLLRGGPPSVTFWATSRSRTGQGQRATAPCRSLAASAPSLCELIRMPRPILVNGHRQERASQLALRTRGLARRSHVAGSTGPALRGLAAASAGGEVQLRSESGAGVALALRETAPRPTGEAAGSSSARAACKESTHLPRPSAPLCTPIFLPPVQVSTKPQSKASTLRTMLSRTLP